MIAVDIMTVNPRTIRSTDSLGQALEVLQSLEVRHLPVVDELGHLVGMLSDRDLGSLVRVFTEGAEAERLTLPLNTRSVAEVMSSFPISVASDADILEVIDQMLEERIGAVPVVDDAENVIGIISYVDVLRSFAASVEELEAEELERGAPAGAAEPTIPPDALAASAYAVRPWAGGWGVFSGDANAVVEPYRTAADAVVHAKELAKRSAAGAHVRVYDDEGMLVSELFYQRDERPALERDGAIPSIAASRPARRRRPDV
jgi:acetoin utilization protein AcuB